MGQLQKRFEQQSQADFMEAPDATVTWKPGSTEPVRSSPEGVQVRPVQVPRWQMRALFIGAVIIVSLFAVLLLG